MNTAALPWRAAHAPSLPEVHRSVAVPSAASAASNAKRALAFAGAGYLVAVGYMDPGNWATSIAGGSQFGYSLLAVILISNLMAMLFQAAAVRLGLASGRDLAQMCREQYPPAISFMSSTRRRSASCSGSCARSRSLPATSPKCSAWRSG